MGYMLLGLTCGICSLMTVVVFKLADMLTATLGENEMKSQQAYVVILSTGLIYERPEEKIFKVFCDENAAERCATELEEEARSLGILENDEYNQISQEEFHGLHLDGGVSVRVDGPYPT